MTSALENLLYRLRSIDACWMITGSTAVALYGRPVSTADIDILSDREGSQAIGSALAQTMVVPVRFTSTGRLRSYFGRAQLDGIAIDIIGDMEVMTDDGWHLAPRGPLIYIALRRTYAPVQSWDALCRFYRLLGREDMLSVLR